MRKLEIEQMLTISTGHLRRGTLDRLDKGDIDGIVNWPKGEYGHFVWVPDAGITAVKLGTATFEHPDDVPKELIVALEFAREQGCAWLCCDCDGDVVEGLVTYEH